MQRDTFNATNSYLQHTNSLQSKCSKTSNQSLLEEEDNAEMKDIRHLPKEKMVEATNALFAKKVKELSFPENPTLFSLGPGSTKGNSKKQGKTLMNYF